MSEALLPLGSDSNPWHTTAFDSVAFGESLNTAELFGEPWLQVPTTASDDSCRRSPFLQSTTFCVLRTWHSYGLSLTTSKPVPMTVSLPFELLKNANVAAGGILPMCQDTGTAIVHAWRGRTVHTAGGDEAAPKCGYQKRLRPPQSALFATGSPVYV